MKALGMTLFNILCASAVHYLDPSTSYWTVFIAFTLSCIACDVYYIRRGENNVS